MRDVYDQPRARGSEDLLEVRWGTLPTWSQVSAHRTGFGRAATGRGGGDAAPGCPRSSTRSAIGGPVVAVRHIEGGASNRRGPEAYKPIGPVIDAQEQAGLIRPGVRLKPWATFKV